ncbi:uncharacterized protein [Euphorbia lathyris]|uniref:uncharacterized protein isoform X2 n=1 Tax=Euphorbia lathyris TaxID=212925 RepID=UPI003314318B
MRMEQSPYGSKRREEEADYREWSLRPHQISRDNTKSRRFSGSHIRTYRDDNATSFRSYITISSTASSPGYPFKEEIDPSTYSFTTALKALQARAGFNNNYSWECSSPDGFALNSKWNEAEKYICNPLSGEVPLECLSSKTLSGRSFRNSTSNRVTMSAPLVYNSHRPIFTAKPSISSTATPEHDETIHFPIQEKKMVDIGTQSTPPDVSSSSHSPPPLKSCEVITEEDGHFLNCNDKLKDEEKVQYHEMDECTLGKALP